MGLGIGNCCCAGSGCDPCTCLPTSLGFWMQYSQAAISCYTCDACDPDAFQVILPEVTVFSAADITAEVHQDCTLSEVHTDNVKDWLLNRDCIQKYYSGGFDTGCKVCEVDDPVTCDPDNLQEDFFATKTIYYYYATLAGEGSGCTVRIILYIQYWVGEGATAIAACENLCHLQTVFGGSMVVATTGDCCDYHDLESHTAPTAESWACNVCSSGISIEICGASLALAPPPPPGDPKYGTVEFICV